MVERGGLENRCGRKPTVGSNPTLSAIPSAVKRRSSATFRKTAKIQIDMAGLSRARIAGRPSSRGFPRICTECLSRPVCRSS